jgi:hypothetical protein
LFCSKGISTERFNSHETVDGDLDGDKIPEKVIVYNTKTTMIPEPSVKFRF